MVFSNEIDVIRMTFDIPRDERAERNDGQLFLAGKFQRCDSDLFDDAVEAKNVAKVSPPFNKWSFHPAENRPVSG